MQVVGQGLVWLDHFTKQTLCLSLFYILLCSVYDTSKYVIILEHIYVDLNYAPLDTDAIWYDVIIKGFSINFCIKLLFVWRHFW